MTEQEQTTVDNPPADPVHDDTDSGAQAHEGDETGAQSPSREAAKWRTQLREVEAERDSLSQRITAMAKAEIERLAGAALSHPSDIFTLSGNDVSDFLTDDGRVDPAKVAADVEAILWERPGLKMPARAVDPSQGHGHHDPAKPTWESMFR